MWVIQENAGECAGKLVVVIIIVVIIIFIIITTIIAARMLDQAMPGAAGLSKAPQYGQEVAFSPQHPGDTVLGPGSPEKLPIPSKARGGLTPGRKRASALAGGTDRQRQLSLPAAAQAWWRLARREREGWQKQL